VANEDMSSETKLTANLCGSESDPPTIPKRRYVGHNVILFFFQCPISAFVLPNGVCRNMLIMLTWLSNTPQLDGTCLWGTQAFII